MLYKGNEGKGCIITSGNFTDNVMKNNHEYGVFLDNDSVQEEIRKQIHGLDCSELSYEEVVELTEKAYEFTDKHSVTKTPMFRAADYIKNRVILPDNCRFFVKPLGNKNRPVGEGYTIIEDNDIGFSKKPPGISQGDILICYSVKVGNVLGCCKVLKDEAKEGTAFKGDRWNFKLTTSCISEQYSSHWWDYDIKIFELADEFNKIKKDGERVTPTNDTLDALKYQHPYIKLRKSLQNLLWIKYLMYNSEIHGVMVENMGYLIKNTTKEEREKIVAESLGNISASCDGCSIRIIEMYQPYIDGLKELRDVNMEFHARYVTGDELPERENCLGGIDLNYDHSFLPKGFK